MRKFKGVKNQSLIYILSVVLVLAITLMFYNHLESPICKKCYDINMIPEILLTENVSNPVQVNKNIVSINIQKYIDVQNGEVNEINTIPFITHYIYFSHNQNPKPISKKVTQIMQNSIGRLKLEEKHWQHYFWTDNPALVPFEIRQIPNLVIKDFNEFTTDKLHRNIVDKIDKGQTSHRFFAQASDILRVLVIEKYGGIYLDLDYEIFDAREFIRYLKRFSFIGGIERPFFPTYSSIANDIFAAAPQNKIIKNIKNILFRNLNDHNNLPKYLEYPCHNFSKLIFETGPTIFSVGIYTLKDLDKEDYILMPDGVLCNFEAARSNEVKVSSKINPNIRFYDGKYYPIKQIGNDIYACSWCEKDIKQEICYK